MLQTAHNGYKLPAFFLLVLDSLLRTMNDGAPIGNAAGAPNVMNTSQLNSVTPGQFPHQGVNVRTTPRTPNTFPHANTGPGQVPSIDTPRTKGWPGSHELVSVALVPTPWRTQNFHKLIVPGELLFSRKERESGTFPLASLAQLNIMLAQGYNQLEVESNNYIAKGTIPSGYSNFERVVTHYKKYKEQGEAALMGNELNPAIYDQILNDTVLQRLMYVSLKHILDRWTYLGLYVSLMNDPNATNKNAVNVGFKGYADTEPVKNIWGDAIAPGESLFIILRRHKDTARSTKEHTVYTHFEFVPYNTYEIYPPSSELYYEDDAGIAHQGVAFHVGKVVFQPERKFQSNLASQMLGINTTAETASMAAKQSTSSVVVNLGTPAHRLGLY